MESLKQTLFKIFYIFLHLPTSMQVAICVAIGGAISWMVAKWLFWVWNKNDDRGIGHAGRLGRFAEKNGFEYFPGPPPGIAQEYASLSLFDSPNPASIEHLLRKRMGDLETTIFLFVRESGHAGWRGDFFTTVISFRLRGADYPDMTLHPQASEGLPDEVVVDPDLARSYTIRAVEQHPVHRFFTPGMVALFEREADWCMAFGGDRVSMWRPLRNDTSEAPTHGVAEEFDPAISRMPVKDLPAELDAARELFDLIAAAAGRSLQTAESKAVTRFPSKKEKHGQTPR